MDQDRGLLWKLSAEGTIDEIRKFVAGLGPTSIGSIRPLAGGGVSQAAVLAGGPSMLAGGKALRSKDALVETHVLQSAENIQEFLALVREYWTLLRDRGLADANPVKIFATADDSNTVVFIFRWKSAESRTLARMDAEVDRIWAGIRASSTAREWLPMMNEVYQGFEYKRFPTRGGIELLRGKCTCMVKLDALPEPFELDGQNGFVIMHRGPRMSQGDSSLMPVNILAHGADSPVANVMGDRVASPIRVEQNTELPQFGIIRSLRSPLAGPGEPDFPATAMWVVHWRIHTPMGTVITDPKVPLVFGPTTVQHYPPVGTEFKSATGPVDIMDAGTGEVVGKLTPGELTAFDIVVTIDDEIPSVMDRPTEYHVKMFNKVVKDPNQRITTEGLANDYRVPASVLAAFEE